MGTTKSHGNDVSALMPMAQGLYGETQPLTKETLGQAMEALQTGGVAARIPQISSATAQSQNALSQTLLGMRGDAASRGLSNSPLTLGQVGQTELAGRQQIAGIGPQFAGGATASGQSVFQAILGALGSTRQGSTSSKGGGA